MNAAGCYRLEEVADGADRPTANERPPWLEDRPKLADEFIERLAALANPLGVTRNPRALPVS